MNVNINIAYSDALQDVDSAEYKAAARSVRNMFEGGIKALARQRNLRVKSMKIVFIDLVGRRKRRDATTAVKIETVYETLDAATGDMANFKSGLTNAFTKAAEAAISGSNGDFVARNFKPQVAAAAKEVEVEVLNPSMKIKRGDKEMNFPQAAAFCRRHNMSLPKPQNKDDNMALKQFGETWLNVKVNSIFDNDGEYGNWKRRQRGFFQDNGEWDVMDAQEVQPFYCVGSEDYDMSCEDIFQQNPGVLQVAQWRMREANEVGFHSFNTRYLNSIDLGTQLRYRCPGRRSQAMICVRIGDREDGRSAFVKCRGNNCGTFRRNPFQFNENNLC